MTPVEIVLSRLPSARECGNEWKALCPAHDDRNPSLSVSVGTDGKALLKCFAGCSTSAVVEALGLSLAELMPPTTEGASRRRKVAEYRYRDASGAHRYTVLRYEPKDFRQCTADGAWSLKGVRRVPYRVNELLGRPSVFVVEGEKDADALWRIGLPATCNVGGAGKWRDDYTMDLKAAGVTRVCVIADNDAPGRDHAQAIVASCHAAGLEARILDLPNLPPKGDVSDWLAAGGTKVGLAALAQAAPAWVPAADAGPDVRPASNAPIGVPILTRVADVEAKAIDWIWPGRIAVGKLSIVSGDPGLGKSFATMDWAARVSQGRPWPDGAPACPPMSVLLLSAEDAVDDTIRPRLDAMGADVTRIHVVTGILTAERERNIYLSDIAAIEAAVDQTGASLVIVDPLSAYLGGADSHRDSDVRGLLAPLATLADRRRLAVIGVMHLNKAPGQRAIYRAGGSIAFTAAARIVLAVAKDPEQDDRRILASVKTNLPREAAALAYRLVDGRVEWDDQPVPAIDVDALLSPVSGAQADDRSAAEDFIDELLRDATAWPLEAKSVIAAGREHGIPDRTLRWTAKKMGIRIERTGFGGAGRWLWHRPAIAASIPASALATETIAPMEPIAPMAIGGAFQGVADGDPATSRHSGNVAGNGSEEATHGPITI